MASTSDSLQKQGRAAAKTARTAAKKVRSRAEPVIKRVSGQVWSGVEQGLDASVKASNSVVAYTKRKPVKALALAAATGALLHAALNLIKPSSGKQANARNR